MNKLDLAKSAVSIVVGAGTSKIVGSIIKNNVSPEKLTDKVTIAAATFVVGAMVADATSMYTNAKIDELAAWCSKKRDEFKGIIEESK